jgi:hypothetical protein
MSARPNSTDVDRETWITATFGDGTTVEYWGDPEEAAPSYVYYDPLKRDPDRETWITSIFEDGQPAAGGEIPSSTSHQTGTSRRIPKKPRRHWRLDRKDRRRSGSRCPSPIGEVASSR